MNAEIYIIKEPTFLEQETDKRIDDIINLLNYTDFHVLYRSIVENTKGNLEEAFCETNKCIDKIDLVIIIGGLYNEKNCLIKSYFKDKGINLEWDRLSKEAEFLYTQAAGIPGLCVKYLNRNVILLPKLEDNLLNIIKSYVVPFLMNKDIINEDI